nr:UDP-glycosyltransferase UGT5-like [Cherax quadricarinatus]XP_053656175.1 UDP-glycosyltransferase UGT5-like [Cherax quadricarinatus]
MKSPTTCVLVVMLVGSILGKLSPPERSYKILMLLPVSSRSHRNIFTSLAESLADRGHKIVMLINQPKSSRHPNIEDVPHGLPHYSEDNLNFFGNRKDPSAAFEALKDILLAFARELYQVPVVKNLYNRRKEFDVIIIDLMFNEIVYPFLHEVPFITLATSGVEPRQSSDLGNVLNPAYAPHFLKDYPRPMSLWHRFRNALAHTSYLFHWRKWSVVPLIQKEISAQFPELPLLLDLERNVSLSLLNSHFSISTPLPLLPSQVELGAMHCRPASSLSQELESWITGSESSGVIYFSLGTFASSASMPVQYRDLFIQAFRRLPQRVLWKYEEELEEVPDNVMIRKWLPQQDILGHNSVKVFMTHGGLLSMQEAIYHARPLLAVPIFGDQPKHAMFIRNSGIGDFLIWEELTVDMIVDAITEILNNPKYQENVLRMSVLLRDQPVPPRELAVFWTEYVIRHRGAPQLRSPAAQLSWVEFLMLDVIFLLYLALIVLIFILRHIYRVITAKLFSSEGKMKNT